MQHLDRTFAALSDPTRRAIVARLASGETPVSTLAEPFDMSLTAVSKHVRMLSDAGLVTVSKRGRTRYCRLNTSTMSAVERWMADRRAIWERRLDRLGDFLDEQPD